MNGGLASCSQVVINAGPVYPAGTRVWVLRVWVQIDVSLSVTYPYPPWRVYLLRSCNIYIIIIMYDYLLSNLQKKMGATRARDRSASRPPCSLFPILLVLVTLVSRYPVFKKVSIIYKEKKVPEARDTDASRAPAHYSLIPALIIVFVVGCSRSHSRGCRLCHRSRKH